MTQRWRERWGERGWAETEKEGGRSPSGAILPRTEGMHSSTVISLHLQPAPSRILIVHIPQRKCLPNTLNSNTFPYKQPNLATVHSTFGSDLLLSQPPRDNR